MSDKNKAKVLLTAYTTPYEVSTGAKMYDIK